MKVKDYARGISRLYKSYGMRDNRERGASPTMQRGKDSGLSLEKRTEPDGGGGVRWTWKL